MLQSIFLLDLLLLNLLTRYIVDQLEGRKNSTIISVSVIGTIEIRERKRYVQIYVPYWFSRE